MRRFLYIWLANWPLDRLRRARLKRPQRIPSKPGYAALAKGKSPFVLVESGAGGLRVVAANGAALAEGVEIGLTVSDACARAPGLASEPIDRASDRAAHLALAHWMTRYSPLVSLMEEADTGLWLETTGCDHLLGGERAMADEISARLSGFGFRHTMAFAPSPGAAAALALSAPQTPQITCEDTLRNDLASLPVATLRLAPDTCQLLRRFGLTRIGQLYTIDRKALARRFASREAAEAVLLRLDQALGLRHEALTTLRPAPAYTTRLECPEPLLHLDGVRAGLETLMNQLSEALAAHGCGARGFRLKAYRSDGTLAQTAVRAARPVRKPAHALRLFEDSLETIDPGFGIDLMALEAERVGTMEAGAPALSAVLSGGDVDEVELSALADRITARLGPQAVQVSTPQESHIPECAEARAAYSGTLPDWPEAGPTPTPRPLKLFARPEPIDVLAEVPDGPPLNFVWRRVPRRVARADGPERIAPEWWQDAGETSDLPGAGDAKRARDYYRIEDELGRRYWVFRHGLYGDGRGNPPTWYVHGLFS
ncbi:MAG: DNA polymerase Y family protein [Pseudomonadota bacterium]